MPHVRGEDLASSDDIRVYKDEGNDEDEIQSSENLNEDKLGLVSESEAGKSTSDRDNAKTSAFDDVRLFSHLFPRPPLFGYPFLSPYSYSNGISPPVVGNKVLPPAPNPFMPPLYGGDIAQPPPAHMGIPAVPFGAKRSLLSSPLLACTTPPLPYPPLYPPDFTPWSTASGYPPLGAGPFGGAYSSPLAGFGGSLLGLVPPGVSHPALVAQTGGHEPHSPSLHHHASSRLDRRGMSESPAEKRRSYVKKPLNAFMLFMKEMRPKVIEESTLKESAAINQILGRKWHELSRAEQTRYYEMARQEKELHAKSNPNWSARDNYGLHSKRKKKREITCQHTPDKDSPGAKKCRAHFGLDQQSQWCKPCRRKKRCIRFKREAGDPEDSCSDDDSDNDNANDNRSRSRSAHTRNSAADVDALSPLSFADENSSSAPSSRRTESPLLRPLGSSAFARVDDRMAGASKQQLPWFDAPLPSQQNNGGSDDLVASLKQSALGVGLASPPPVHAAAASNGLWRAQVGCGT